MEANNASPAPKARPGHLKNRDLEEDREWEPFAPRSPVPAVASISQLFCVAFAVVEMLVFWGRPVWESKGTVYPLQFWYLHCSCIRIAKVGWEYQSCGFHDR
jgi:hypothetical protein